MNNRKPYPILSALKREGDTSTLRSLRVWMDDYGTAQPPMAANDNNPESMPAVVETRVDAVSAERLVLSMEEDAKCAADPEYERTTKPYSAALHQERFERVKISSKTAAPPTEVDAETEMAKYIDAIKVRAWLGVDAEVLDMAIGPFTYREVGRHLGASGSNDTIERAGKRGVKGIAKIFWDEVA